MGRNREVKPITENPHLGNIEELFEKFKRMIYKLVNRYASKAYANGVEFDDLKSIGYMGFLKAYDKYDPTRFEGQVTKFSTYLVPMVIGEIRRELRDYSPAGVKFSRRDKEYAYMIMKEELEELTPEEIASELGISPASAENGLLYIRHRKSRSLQDVVFHNDGDAITLEEQLESEEDYSSLFVDEFLDKLEPRQRMITDLLFRQGLTQNEVGERLGISQVQISRLSRRIKAVAEEHFFGGKKPEVIEYTPKKRLKLKVPKELMDERKVEAKKLLAETDLSLGEICAKTKVAYTFVVYWSPKIRGKGKVIGNGRPLKYGTKEALDIAKKLVEETDMSYKQIAEETGIAYHSVSCHGRKVRGKAVQGGKRESELTVRQLTPEERVKYGLDNLNKTPEEDTTEGGVVDEPKIPFTARIKSKKTYNKGCPIWNGIAKTAVLPRSQRELDPIHDYVRAV